MKDDDILIDNRDHFQYMKTVVKAKSDPVWFINNVLEQKLYPKQEEIVREFYRSRYDVTLPQYKRLTLIAGMRPLTGNTLVQTFNGLEYIDEILDYDELQSINIDILTRYGYSKSYHATCKGEESATTTTSTAFFMQKPFQIHRHFHPDPSGI